MALLSDYTAGTVTIAANGTAVTGSGTAWLAAGFGEGDLLIANGYFGLVGSVQSNTALTLSQPWRGGALSGAGYRLRYQGDGSRISAQARQLIELLGGSGNLEALGKLAAGANQMPYFTGAGQMAATPLTAFARTLLGGADQAAMRATLGVDAAGMNVAKTGGTMTGPLNVPSPFAVAGAYASGISGYEPLSYFKGPSGITGTIFRDSISGVGDILGVEAFKQGDSTVKTAICLQPFGGRVGIGTNAPSSMLTVAGDAAISGALTVDGNVSTKSEMIVGLGKSFSKVQMDAPNNTRRYIYNDGSGIGFLGRTSNWILKVSDDGTFQVSNPTTGASGYIYPNGNVGGSIWAQWGANDAFSAINAKIASLFSGVFNQSGYLKLQNGLIIQWGRANTSGAANVTLPFPITFPNAVYSVVATNIVTIPDNNTFYAVSIDDPQRGSFNARGRYFSNGGGLGAAQLDFCFIAIGV